MPFLAYDQPVPRSADIAVAGTGFAASFFLHRLLQDLPRDRSVLVFERGSYRDHPTIIDERHHLPEMAQDLYRSLGDEAKPWGFSIGLGGSSNCWVGNTPRMLPADFELASRYGVGRDWPFDYHALEPFYVEAERLMQIAGGGAPAPMSTPYPLPPHGLSDPERRLQEFWPERFFPMPSARASRSIATRPQCCANGVCSICPVDAKFTILNGMAQVYGDPRVTVVTGTAVQALDITAGRAQGFFWRGRGGDGRSQADHLVLAANAIFNAHILLRSGDPHPLTGRRLHEQVGMPGRVYLDGTDSFQGGTLVSGYGTMLYDDPDRRRTRGAALLETNSVGRMRAEPGRWRQVLPIRLVIEDLPNELNLVRLDPQAPEKPIAEFNAISDYARRALETGMADLEHVFRDLPVERIELRRARSENHIQGTTVMGGEPETSVVDQDGLHHVWRDVRLLGSSVFPTGAPANPTLTLSAHALRAAARMEAW